MNTDRLKDLPRETLIEVLEMALRNIRTVDGLWFLGVEEKYGTDTAVTIDRIVWERMAPIEAKRLKQALKLTGTGIAGVVEAMRNSMTWISFAGEYEVEEISENQAVFRVKECLPQRARLEKQIGLFPCGSVEQAYLASFAQAIDPRVKVRCGFCPPERSSDQLWCEWFFEIDPA